MYPSKTSEKIHKAQGQNQKDQTKRIDNQGRNSFTFPSLEILFTMEPERREIPKTFPNKVFLRDHTLRGVSDQEYLQQKIFVSPNVEP